MKTYQDFKKDEVIESKINVTCIGAFDGLHRGHIELIKKTKEIDNNFQIVTFNEIPKIYFDNNLKPLLGNCLLYTSPSPRDLSTSRMPSSA